MNERKVFSVRLRPGIWRRLKSEARRTGMKLFVLVELALVHELDRRAHLSIVAKKKKGMVK